MGDEGDEPIRVALLREVPGTVDLVGTGVLKSGAGLWLPSTRASGSATRSALQAGRRIEELLPRTTGPGMRILGSMAHGMSTVLAGEGGADRIRDAVELLARRPVKCSATGGG